MRDSTNLNNQQTTTVTAKYQSHATAKSMTTQQELTNARRLIIIFWTWPQRRPAMLQVDCFWGDAISKKAMSPMPLETRNQTTNAAGFFVPGTWLQRRPAMPP